MPKGEPLTATEVKRVCRLLRETDTEISDIARRFNCSSYAILRINRAYSIRHYYGRRKSWMVGGTWLKLV